MTDWRIGSHRGTCAACEHTYENDEPHYSLLRVTSEELQREDLCRKCFPERDATADVVWWRTKHHDSKQGGLRLDLESIEALFVALEPRKETRMRELRYLLALILMRKRRLKVHRLLKTEEGEAFALRRPRRDEDLLVYVFELTPERQEELREELKRIFDQPELNVLEMGAESVAEGADEADEGEFGRQADEEPDVVAESRAQNFE